MNCTASGALDIAIPNWAPPPEDPTADTAANRGTRMHELFAEVNALTAKQHMGFARSLLYVAELRKQRRFKLLIEQPMMAHWLDVPQSTTADLVLYTQDCMHIVDFKWGSIFVDVVGNEQLLFYAATYGPLAPRAKEVTLHIVQPNADAFDSWTVDTATIRKFMHDALTAERKLAKGHLSFSPGDHCQFCPANPHSRAAKGSPLCPAMMEMLYPAPFDEAELLKEEE